VINKNAKRIKEKGKNKARKDKLKKENEKECRKKGK
jgi:hypothetical protein